MVEALLLLPDARTHWHSQDLELLTPVATHRVRDQDGGVYDMIATTTQLTGGWHLFEVYEPTVAGPHASAPAPTDEK
ncbi:hypothetical protein OG948_58550 (plasmid) [Embleya sp. NBC_00888]|uniref:hypothetical protein n=1 Tax=Embleya sp. NBC_00888 TaxID=2975960 RepID=UPI002F90D2E4|nr:hypothetical protein OG948_58550 [Embleya sp. NBC_00888]